MTLLMSSMTRQKTNSEAPCVEKCPGCERCDGHLADFEDETADTVPSPSLDHDVLDESNPWWSIEDFSGKQLVLNTRAEAEFGWEVPFTERPAKPAEYSIEADVNGDLEINLAEPAPGRNSGGVFIRAADWMAFFGIQEGLLILGWEAVDQERTFRGRRTINGSQFASVRLRLTVTAACDGRATVQGIIVQTEQTLRLTGRFAVGQQTTRMGVFAPPDPGEEGEPDQPLLECCSPNDPPPCYFYTVQVTGEIRWFIDPFPIECEVSGPHLWSYSKQQLLDGNGNDTLGGTFDWSRGYYFGQIPFTTASSGFNTHAIFGCQPNGTWFMVDVAFTNGGWTADNSSGFSRIPAESSCTDGHFTQVFEWNAPPEVCNAGGGFNFIVKVEGVWEPCEEPITDPRRFDNVLMSACGEENTEECPRPKSPCSVCDSTDGAYLPCIILNDVVPLFSGTSDLRKYQGHWVRFPYGNHCGGWVVETPVRSVVVLPNGTAASLDTLFDDLYRREDEVGNWIDDENCLAPQGRYVHIGTTLGGVAVPGRYFYVEAEFDGWCHDDGVIP